MVCNKKLLDEDFSFSKKKRPRSKSGSKPARTEPSRDEPSTSAEAPQESGPSGRVIHTQSRAYDGHSSRGRHKDRGRPMGSGHLDRSHSDQRPAPRENERRDREEASRGTYRGNGRAIHSDTLAERGALPPETEQALCLAGLGLRLLAGGPPGAASQPRTSATTGTGTSAWTCQDKPP